MPKVPNYRKMDPADLDAESGRRYARMQEIGLLLNDGDLDDQARFDLEVERAEHRAHCNIIAPIRAQRLVRENRLRDPELHRQAGMSDEEFEAYQAEMRALRQEVKMATGPDGEMLDPGASQ